MPDLWVQFLQHEIKTSEADAPVKRRNLPSSMSHEHLHQLGMGGAAPHRPPTLRRTVSMRRVPLAERPPLPPSAKTAHAVPAVSVAAAMDGVETVFGQDEQQTL